MDSFHMSATRTSQASILAISRKTTKSSVHSAGSSKLKLAMERFLELVAPPLSLVLVASPDGASKVYAKFFGHGCPLVCVDDQEGATRPVRLSVSVVHYRNFGRTGRKVGTGMRPVRCDHRGAAAGARYSIPGGIRERRRHGLPVLEAGENSPRGDSESE